jgi:hypothetical protein
MVMQLLAITHKHHAQGKQYFCGEKNHRPWQQISVHFPQIFSGQTCIRASSEERSIEAKQIQHFLFGSDAYREDELILEGKPVSSYATHSHLWLVQYTAAVTLCTLDGAGTKECIG